MSLGNSASPFTSAYVKDDIATEPEITEPSQHPSREGDGIRGMVAGGGPHCENV